jgi:hypothetical protein
MRPRTIHATLLPAVTAPVPRDTRQSLHGVDAVAVPTCDHQRRELKRSDDWLEI